MELDGSFKRAVKTLSGGQRRRLDIALGLVHPTVFLTTHYLEEVDALCARLFVIDHGEIVALGTPDELKSHVSGDPVRPGLFESAFVGFSLIAESVAPAVLVSVVIVIIAGNFAGTFHPEAGDRRADPAGHRDGRTNDPFPGGFDRQVGHEAQREAQVAAGQEGTDQRGSLPDREPRHRQPGFDPDPVHLQALMQAVGQRTDHQTKNEYGDRPGPRHQRCDTVPAGDGEEQQTDDRADSSDEKQQPQRRPAQAAVLRLLRVVGLMTCVGQRQSPSISRSSRRSTPEVPTVSSNAETAP